MKKLILLSLIAAMLIPVLTGCGSETDDDLAKISEQVLLYKIERNHIEEEIEEVWNEYDKQLSGGECCFVLFFDNMSPNLVKEVYPLVNNYGYKGTVVMKDGEIPGNSGCISVYDYNRLINAGWDFAIGTGSVDLSGDDAVENLSEYLKEYKTNIETAGIEFPVTFAFSEEQYDAKYTPLLLEYGFKVVRHFGETGDKFSYSIGRDRIYLLASDIICSGKTNMKADMQSAYKEKATYSASVRYIQEIAEDDRKDCSKDKYKLMLDFVDRSCEDANVFTATELYEYKTNTLSGSEDYMEEFDVKMNELEKSLEEVNSKIDELTASLID